MTGEKDLNRLLLGLNPRINNGEYVFATVQNISDFSRDETLFEFKEREGTTVVLQRTIADAHGLRYDFVASWITLEVHSSLEAVGLTATFSTALGEANISCNVVAGYYHDHIFVSVGDATRAMEVLVALKGE